MARILIVALSDAENTFDLARRIEQLDPGAYVLVTADLPVESAASIMSEWSSLVDQSVMELQS